MANREKLFRQEDLLIQLIRNGSNVCGYLIGNRQGVLSDSLAARYNAPNTVEDLPNWMIGHDHIAPESLDAWQGLFDAIHQGEQSGAVMVSMREEGGTFVRYWVRFNLVLDEEKNPVLAVLSLDDFAASLQQERLKDNDINSLLQATRRTFPEIVTVDLTHGSYRMIQYDSSAALSLPKEGMIDDMIAIRLANVVEEDRASFMNTLSRRALEQAFLREGRESVDLAYRRVGRTGKVSWVETSVTGQPNTVNDDILLVAMSRSVDAQKAEELRLREALRVQAEELRLTMSQVGKLLAYYDIPTRTLTFPPVQAKLRFLSPVTTDFPASFIAQSPAGFPPATLEILRDFYHDICQGAPTGSCEYQFLDSKGGERWERVEFASVFDTDGQPLRAVLAIDDVTAHYIQSAENQRLKENEYILRLTAQHSDRTICHYDIKNRTARIWDPETCAKCQLPRLCEMTFQQVLDSGNILPESTEDLERMFAHIHRGTPKGSIRMRVKTPSGERRWFDLRYSTVFDDQGAPVSALISHKDITEQYEHELAYIRLAQTMSEAKNHIGTLEVDLTTDTIDHHGGKMAPPGGQSIGRPFSAFGAQMVAMKLQEADQEEGYRFFSRDYLLTQYAEGNRRLKRDWPMKFRDGKTAWVRTVAELMADPYTNHIKVFFRMTDIHDKKQAEMAIQDRSERDGMTGLYNRATAEERILEKLADKSRPGILILLDLDDLKGINDTFGHKEGDRAITGISTTLKSHFRESDILGRIGGDEFIIYLPGSAINSDAIAVSLSSLLRKLASIPIGAGDQQRIHCSIGGAIQVPDSATFEDLFKQADTALYHVKRSGKNNFAFYDPEMEKADYQFQAQRLLSLQGAKKFELAELQHLLSAISAFYPLVLSMNLSTNDYHLLDEVQGGIFSKLPPVGMMDDFVDLTTKLLHPDDVPGYLEKLSRQSLLNAYAEGEQSIRHYFRFQRQGESLWTEASIIFYTNEKGDVCDFTLVRWADERAYELEQLWLQKILELAVASVFEYIALINIDSGAYTIYGSETNSHAIPKTGNFDDITRDIQKNFIPPSEQAAYYQKARLSTILGEMRDTDIPYTYQYTMPSGRREASFYWFEPSHGQILMTVQRCR